MNLQTEIKPELWLSIARTYEAQNYSHAILDAMHHLTDVLRTKSGVDADGASLVGQALGGDTPPLRVNKLQTDTDRDVQKGLENIIRGLYVGIRNPRSHELSIDTKETADALVIFIDYILGIIGQSQEPFTLSTFLARVFDTDFVPSMHYAEMVTSEIPKHKRLDTIIEIYRKRTEGNGAKLAFSVKAITAQLSDEQLSQFLTVVSDDVETDTDEKLIRFTLQIMPPQLWPKISELARWRIENKLIESINAGEENSDHKVTSGALGTWSAPYLQFFTHRKLAAIALLGKLEDTNDYSRAYVARFFMTVLPVVIEEEWQVFRCTHAISSAVKAGDLNVTEKLIGAVRDYPDNWWSLLKDQLKDLADPEFPATYLPDGSPFLKGTAETELPF